MALSQNKLSNTVKIFSIMAMIAMFVFAIVSYHANIQNILVFLVFFVFYIQLPGLLILDRLNIAPSNLSTKLLFSFFSGWAINIFLYFISDLLRTNYLLLLVCPILSIVFIIIKARSPKTSLNITEKYNSLSSTFFLFACLSLLFILLNTQYLYLSPESSDIIYMNPDKAYHLGLIDSLSHDYPLQSPWIQGRFIKYHIFTEILYAIPVKIFGLSSDTILMSCGPYLTCYAICLSFYSLFQEFSNKKDRAGLYCLLVLLSNIFIGKYIYSSIAFRFIFVNENAAGYGIAGALALLILIRYWYQSREEGNSKAYLFLLVILTMLETGIKGPMAAVIVAALVGTFLVALIMKKTPLKTILPILLILLSFILVYATVLGLKGQSNGSGEAVFSFGTITNIAFWKKSFVAWMTSLHIPSSIRLVIILLVFYVFMTTAFCLPFVIGYIREMILVFSKKKDFDFSKVVIYATTMVGLLAMFFLNYSGHSQIYFGLVSVFLVPLIGFWLFEDLELAGNTKSRLYRVLKICFIVMISITTISLAVYYGHKISNVKDYLNSDTKHSKYLSISNDEYVAMKWLEENTPDDSLIAADRYYSVPLKNYSYSNRWSNRFFLYAAYSNRFYYISGSGYNLGAKEWPIRKKMIELNNKLYQSSYNNRAKLANKLGIDYIVVSKRFTKNSNLSDSHLKLCYYNSDVNIYEVLKNNSSGM